MRNLKISILGFIFFFCGCITFTHFSGTAGHNCSWCRDFIGAHYEIIYNPPWYEVKKDGVIVVDNLYTEESAKDFIRKQDSGALWYEGMPFCSLRCINAYKASTEIKEKRYRIIPHE